MRRSALVLCALLALLALLAPSVDAGFTPGRPLQRINGAGAVAANTTSYLGAAGPQTYANVTPYLINQPCLVTRIYIEFTVAPGSGQTFSFALYRSGNLITGTAGSATGASTYTYTSAPNVALSDRDNLELQVVSSSGAPAATFRYYIETQ